MSQFLLTGAAGLCLFGLYFHGVFGRRMYLGNIRATNAPTRTVSLSAVSWDMFSIVLGVSGFVFIYAAYDPTALMLVYPVLLMHGLGAALFIALALWGHADLWRLPGAYLMGATCLLGGVAVFV